jgi:hypothetical protein
MQILANQAPIGFEAEFVNQRSQTILYRGILLPFSSDDDTIDFIYGVISWKELADQHAADELLLEIDQALEVKPPRAPLLEPVETLTDWADGPGSLAADDLASSGTAYLGDDGLPRPSFGLTDDTAFEVGTDVPLGNATTMTPDNDFDAEEDEDTVEPQGASLTDYAPLFSDPLVPGLLKKKPIQLDGPAGFAEPFETADSGDFADPIELQEFAESLNPADMALGDWLAAAREMAIAARTSEDRTRNALYDAIGRAYDFSLAACDEPEEFEDLLADSGLTMQERAPMTPVVKLVFGADYDKTRLTEYAAALSFAFRSNLPRGSLGDYLAQYDGGLKGVVKAERRLRREDSGKPVEEIDAPRRALAKKLRALPPQDFAAIETEGSEFALVMIRRTATGVVEFLGEVPDDVALVERAARRLIG